MLPFQPPLPTAWNLPFQPGGRQPDFDLDVGLGRRLERRRHAAERRQVGELRAAAAPARRGGVNAPAATGCAIVIVASGSFSDDEALARGRAAAGARAR